MMTIDTTTTAAFAGGFACAGTRSFDAAANTRPITFA